MNQLETINILCATDDNYAPYCGIMLTSLFENNKDCHFDVFVFVSDDISKVNKTKFEKLVQKYRNDIVLITIDDSMVAEFPISNGTYVTKPTYYRLLAATLLPTNINKVIYLDCDIVVIDSIKPLWNVNLEGKALAVCEDCDYQYHSDRLGLSEFGYFNAGVMVINLDYWRKHDLNLEFKEYNFDHPTGLLLMDQDILNGVCFNEKVWLPVRYNFMVSYFVKVLWNSYSDEKRRYYLNECDKAVVLHYAVEKPWNYRTYGGPFFSVWEKYRKKSLWRDCRNTKPFKKHLKHIVKRYLFTKPFRSQYPEWVMLSENNVYYR